MAVKAKAVAKRLDAFSTKVYQEMIRLENLRELLDDHEAACDEIDLERCADYQSANSNLSAAQKKLREVSWELSGIEAKLQDMAYIVDETVDLIESIVPTPTKHR